MFLIDWSSVATDRALDQLRRLAGAGPEVTDETLRPVVAVVLANAGGLPVTDEEWTEAQRTAVCLKLVHEAVGSALRRRRGAAARPILPGCELGPAVEGLERSLVPAERVSVNVAGEEELRSLPVLGPATTRRTIEARRSGGSFGSAQELADRVSGVAESGAERLSLRLDFGLPADRPAPPADLATDFERWLDKQPGEKAGERLLHALETLATIVADVPHPFTVAGRPRVDLPTPPDRAPRTVPVDTVEILEDERFYGRMKDLLDSAVERIDVAMFFISLPGAKHPSRALLERLAEAHDAGRAVRVLVDRDADDDPYGSRVINRPAIDFLRDRGVAVRVDREDVLLHSKFVILDADTVVVGSHNWTAGSFFRYRDTSVALTSAPLNAQLSRRFERMWRAGSDA